MDFKKLIFVFVITISILMISAFGVSYAWYSFSNGNTPFTVQTGSDDDISIIFAQSEYVNISTGVPIVEADVPTKAGISRFVVSPDASLNGAEIALSIELINVNIDNELKCDDFKIQLLENNSVIYTGTGADITSDTLVLKEMSKLNNLNSVNYELRIWINETGVSQNNLMGKAFSGKIKVSTSIKK